MTNQEYVQRMSDFLAELHNIGCKESHPTNLPSCIVRVDCDIPGLNGLEQRDQFGWVTFKHWEYPLPDGAMFVSLPLGIDDMQPTYDWK